MKKLRAGVVGLGMGRGHMGSYIGNDSVEMAAIADINEERLKEVAAETGIKGVYSDALEMFEKEDLDIVSIAVPNKFHAPLTIAALEKGIHVLCEKPMAMNLGEAQQMKKASEEAGKNLMINFSYRFNPLCQALRQEVDKGTFGNIYFGRTVWHRRRGMPGFGGWFGDKGGLVQKNEGQGYDQTAEFYTDKDGELVVTVPDIPDKGSFSPYEEFVSSVLEKRKPSAPAEDGIKVQKILDGLYRSAREGIEIRFDT